MDLLETFLTVGLRLGLGLGSTRFVVKPEEVSKVFLIKPVGVNEDFERFKRLGLGLVLHLITPKRFIFNRTQLKVNQHFENNI